MALSYYLSMDSYICLDRRYCIILNVRSDKYLAASRPTIDCLAPWLSGWRTELSAVETAIPAHIETIAEDFVRLGILTKHSHLGKPLLPQDIQKPTENMLAGGSPSRLQSALPFAYASMRSLLWARNRLSRHSLLSTIHAILERRAACTQSPPELDIIRASFLINVFKHWQVLFSRPQACLYDSLSLLHFLSTFNICPSLVFGVTPDPFQAHCWLQHRTMVLNDRLSRVSDYTPIMLV